VSIDPPKYGIDFLDSELSTTAAVSGRAAAIQLKQATGPGRQVLTANAARAENTRTKPVIQPKLMLGPVDDPYEREAERVARQVASGATGPVAGTDSRALAIWRRAGADGGAVGTGVQQEIEQARGRGQRLPAPARGAMEQALGADFGAVRVHTDAQADRLSRSLQARAFTIGQDIFFRRGEYNPGSSDGQTLLAHELAHVVQQRPGETAETGIRQADTGSSQGTFGNTPTNHVSHTIQRGKAPISDQAKLARVRLLNQLETGQKTVEEAQKEAEKEWERQELERELKRAAREREVEREVELRKRGYSSDF
jgi:hypothetical protein